MMSLSNGAHRAKWVPAKKVIPGLVMFGQQDALMLKNAVDGNNNAASLKSVSCAFTIYFPVIMIDFNILDSFFLGIGVSHCDVV